jgi:hypothetical protein
MILLNNTITSVGKVQYSVNDLLCVIMEEHPNDSINAYIMENT